MLTWAKPWIYTQLTPLKTVLELTNFNLDLAKATLVLFFLSGNELPSEELELTANSLRAHIVTHGKLFLRTLS